VSVDGFIAEVWTARLLAHLETALVFAQGGVVNRDYEGEIAEKGDTVRIGAISDITVKEYTKNSDIDAPEDLDDDMTSLVIDSADYFNFQVDDVDKRQASVPLMDGATQNAAYKMAKKADHAVAVAMATDGTPVVTSETEAYDQLVDCSTDLDERDVPADGRFAIVPPWYYGLLLKDDRFVASGAASAASTLANGQVGEAAGFRVIRSNNGLVNTSDYAIVTGHAIATSYAEQINKVEAFRPERRFADAVKGLHLYGVKVLRPEALAILTASRP
jgi:hypothetical protein